MKYLYLILILVLIGGGYFGYTKYSMSQKDGAVIVPAGYHLMPDGTLMQNEEAKDGVGTENSNQIQDEMSALDSNKSEQSTVTLDPNARVFSIKGVNYGYDIKEIVVKEGDTVTINFESTDGLHDVVIDEFAVATKRVQPGAKTSVTFVADKKGTFEYYCSVGSHRTRGQVGKLIVE